jgi:hypothetical protein
VVAHLRRELFEQVPLLLVLGAVFVRRGEVRHERLDSQACDKRIAQFGRRQAEAVDPCIDHQIAGSAAALQPQPRLVQAVDRRAHAGGSGIRDVFREGRPMEHDDLFRWRMLQQIADLAPVSHVERPAASLAQNGHRVGYANAIGVRLHRCARTRAAGHPVERTPIARQRLAVEPQAQRARGWMNHQLSSKSRGGPPCSPQIATIKATSTTIQVYHSSE